MTGQPDQSVGRLTSLNVMFRMMCAWRPLKVFLVLLFPLNYQPIVAETAGQAAPSTEVARLKNGGLGLKL
jgi:hypothetical protein